MDARYWYVDVPNRELAYVRKSVIELHWFIRNQYFLYSCIHLLVLFVIVQKGKKISNIAIQLYISLSIPRCNNNNSVCFYALALVVTSKSMISPFLFNRKYKVLFAS